MYGSAKKFGGAGTPGLHLARPQVCSPSGSQRWPVASTQSHAPGKHHLLLHSCARPGWCSETELGGMWSTEMRDPGPAPHQLPDSGREGGGVGETCTDDYKAEGKQPRVVVKINE